VALALTAQFTQGVNSPLTKELWQKAISETGTKIPGGGGRRAKKPEYKPTYETNGIPISGDLTSGMGTDAAPYLEMPPGLQDILDAEAEAARQAQTAAQQAGEGWASFLEQFERDRLDAAVDALSALDQTAQSLTDSFKALSDVGGQTGQGWMGALGETLGGLQSRIIPAVQAVMAVGKAGGDMGEAWTKAAPGMIEAIGQTTAAWMDAEWQKYTVLAISQFAAGWASYPDPVGMASHFTASAAYAIAAGMAGGSSPSVGGSAGVGGAGAGNAASAFNSAPITGKDGSATIIVNVGGLVMDEEATYRKIEKGIRRAVNSVGTFGRA
jgi:hypothetical protein